MMNTSTLKTVSFMQKTMKCFFISLLAVGLYSASADIKSQLDQVVSKMTPFKGAYQKGVDVSSLYGKAICGYQGWFAAEGDGHKRGWVHYKEGRRNLEPGNCAFDLWPDMSELDKDEKYVTAFKNKDGSPATLFSSHNPKTVRRHFKWMKDYNIDGVLLQRFGVGLRSPKGLETYNTVLKNVQAGANEYGRGWAMMYDLSGMKKGRIGKDVVEDWKNLVDRSKIKEDRSYLHHHGKPVIGIWGVGFGDDRQYTLDECERLIDFLKYDKKYGGNTVILGVPSFWRTQTRDADANKKLHLVLKKADILSPWTVGRYHNLETVQKYHETVVVDDMKWVKADGLEYLPVAFPGFSWQNLMKVRGVDVKLNQIPRLGGQFLWSQAISYKSAGAKMIYLAMFDEIDEATALFKCTNQPPVGESKFITYENLPSDHYLWLSGKIGELIESENEYSKEMPLRK